MSLVKLSLSELCSLQKSLFGQKSKSMLISQLSIRIRRRSGPIPALLTPGIKLSHCSLECTLITRVQVSTSRGTGTILPQQTVRLLSQNVVDAGLGPGIIWVARHLVSTDLLNLIKKPDLYLKQVF